MPRFYISVFLLMFFHYFPVYKGVNIIEQKCRKANCNRYVFYIFKTCENPENNENNIVTGVGKRKIRTSSECEINRNKTRSDRKRARNQICCIEISENEIKNSRYRSRKAEHKYNFFPAQAVDFNLRLFSFIRMTQPCNKRKSRHRHRHTEISYHLAVIRKCIRNISVKKAENYHQKLTERIAFGVEKYSRHADKRSNKSQNTAPVKNKI